MTTRSQIWAQGLLGMGPEGSRAILRELRAVIVEAALRIEGDTDEAMIAVRVLAYLDGELDAAGVRL